MEIRLARTDDLETYTAIGREAQVWLESRGLGQYVPSAHEENAAAIQGRVASGTLYVVSSGGSAIAFFSLDPAPSPWWPADKVPALYLAGMVVAAWERGHGVGSHVLRWCVAEAARRGCRALRLDCHSANAWLCRYYESHGFTLQGQVEQYPGYVGALYERAVP